MPPRPNPLIAQLADELEPVRPLQMRHGLALVAVATVLTIAVIALWQGLWSGPTDGQATAIFFIANGLIALVGLASARAVVRMAAPRVASGRMGCAGCWRRLRSCPSPPCCWRRWRGQSADTTTRRMG